MKAKSNLLTWLCLCLLWAAPSMAAAQQAAESCPVRARVLEKTIQADRVLLGLHWLGAPPQGAGEFGTSVAVVFKAGAKGCLNLHDTANQKKLAALGAEQGDILLLTLRKGPRGWRADEVRFAASDRAVSFPGREKITPGLAAVLLTPGATAPVIATLDTKASGQALKQQVQKLLKTLPPGSFTPRGSFGRIPVLTGRASLPGLMALAASPLVKAIQSDQKALPTPSAGLAVPSGEVLK